MTIRRNCIALCLIFSTALIGAAAAQAAPAGDEYLPKVPKAAGNQVVAGQDQGGAGSTILQPEIRGADSKGKAGDDATTTDDPNGTESADNSSATLGTLGDPVVLLLLAGVVGMAVAMMLRSRRVASEGLAERPADDDPGKRSGSPSTPDGEIVDDGDEKP